MHLIYNRNFLSADPLTWVLTLEQSHHAMRVLRMRVGDRIGVSDGAGTIAECRLVEPMRFEVEQSQVVAPRPYTIHLAVAPTKNIDRIEWLVEKAVEVGIDRFTPLLAEHSERKNIKIERLLRIVESASAQSQKAFLAVVDELTPVDQFLRAHRGGWIAHCADGSKTALKEAAQTPNYRVLIGPEGDFSPREVELAIGQGYQGLSLGAERLRTETAALVAVVARQIL